MHVWHHAHPDCGPVPRNFGITLSLWDWIFGTAYVPDRPPERLGFEGIESFPSTVPGQMLHPLPAERAARRLFGKTQEDLP
jgi:sterol desaturase/sphingolipid hydroxylase (fatty acid hydroxylase superfamily)